MKKKNIVTIMIIVIIVMMMMMRRRRRGRRRRRSRRRTRTRDVEWDDGQDVTGSTADGEDESCGYDVRKQGAPRPCNGRSLATTFSGLRCRHWWQ